MSVSNGFRCYAAWYISYMVRCNVGTIGGTVVNPSGYEQYTKTQVDDWKSNEDFTHKLLKEPHTGEVFFSPETNWIYFNLELK